MEPQQEAAPPPEQPQTDGTDIHEVSVAHTTSVTGATGGDDGEFEADEGALGESSETSGQGDENGDEDPANARPDSATGSQQIYNDTGDGQDDYQGSMRGSQAGLNQLMASNQEPDDDDDDDDMPMPNRLEMLSARSHSNSSSRPSRPPSAVMDLRGSRPNSAAIAQEIEGFEDDFMERVEEEEEAEYEYEEDDSAGADAEDLGPSVEELLIRAKAEQQRLLDHNEALQKKARLAMDFRNKGRPNVNRDTSRLDGVAVRYRSSLKQWVELLEDRDRVEGHYQTTVFDMKSALEERIKRADDISKAYKHFRMEVAKSAEHSKTGRPISERLLQQLEREDQEKEEEVQRVRLKNIHLSNQLKRMEQTLRQKEELAEGLHLIDFEQLKIENQSLNEKIEERNEELLKLRKKTTTTVQILTHIREKLQFVEKENESLASDLSELDRGLSERRDKLGKSKNARDALRQKARKLKETSTFITHSTLMGDIETQKEKKEQMLFAIEDLKKEHAMLTEVISNANSKIISMTHELASTGAAVAAGASRRSRAGSLAPSRADSARSSFK